MTRITVEFFGVPRERCGVAATTVPGDRLGTVLRSLEKCFPALATDCLASGRLRPGFAANLNGERFVSDPDTPLRDGDTLLIMSADAGG
jgi:molybdopterin converting factor small subunit